MSDPPIDEAALYALRALVDAGRLRIVARLASSPADAPTLARELRQPAPTVSRNLAMLERAGLVERRDETPGRFGARLDRLGDLGRRLADLEDLARGRTPGESTAGLRGAWPHEGEPVADTLARLALAPDELRTLQAHLVGGRLATIPAQGRKRMVVLRFLLERVFTEDRDYPEKEVNQRLALFHPDVASLRRYLVDHGYLERSAGRYRRRAAPLDPPAGHA